jgi:DHA1 family bicyclomycin/chloramphenicol resistance-like MFS transporter/DHA1 family 2-module integral membrane pump EmrD-like MFS transporter
MVKKHSLLILLVIILVGTLTQISTDIYTPSLPSITHLLRGSLGQAQLTMTWFMFGIAITNLLYGPLCEGIGRRWTIVIGNSLAIIGTLLCLTAHSIHALQEARLVQGLGLGASAALWRSIFRDTYSGKEMAKMGSYLTNVIILSVIIAPFLGGYFEQYLGWRSTFVFLFIWTILVTIIVLFFFKETGQHFGKHRLSLPFMCKAYGELLSSRVFMGFSLCVFLSYGSLFAWMTAGPVVLIHGAHIKPVLFGYLMILTGIAMALGGFANAKLVHKFGTAKLMTFGWSLMALAGALTLCGKILFGINVYDIIIPAMLFIFGTSFIFSNAVAGAFTPFGHIAGYAGSLYACIQLLGGVVFSAYLSHLNTSSQAPMAWMFIISGVTAFLAYRFMLKKHVAEQ